MLAANRSKGEKNSCAKNISRLAEQKNLVLSNFFIRLHFRTETEPQRTKKSFFISSDPIVFRSKRERKNTRQLNRSTPFVLDGQQEVANLKEKNKIREIIACVRGGGRVRKPVSV